MLVCCGDVPMLLEQLPDLRVRGGEAADVMRLQLHDRPRGAILTSQARSLLE
jgi:hypothetical protein